MATHENSDLRPLRVGLVLLDRLASVLEARAQTDARAARLLTTTLGLAASLESYIAEQERPS